MPSYVVHLETHQYADVRVEAPAGATADQLTALALRALDDSRGAEWHTEYAETTYKRIAD